MNKIKIIRYTRKSMQRLGYLKLICLIASENSDTLQNFSNKFFGMISNKIKISVQENKENFKCFFLRKLNLSPKYRFLNWKKIKSITKNTEDEEYVVPIEVQDLYLTDKSLPSNTGSVFPDAITDIPSLALELGLLKGNMVVTSRGFLLKILTTNTIKSFLEYNQSNNPLKLTFEEKLILTFYLLCEDYDILRVLLPKICQKKQFGIKNSSDFVSESIKKLIKASKTLVLSINEKEFLNQLAKTAESIKNPKGTIHGTGRSIYQFFLSRCELLCDLGFLDKNDKYSANYTTNTKTPILSDFINRYDHEEFLNNHYFELISRLYALGASNHGKDTSIIIQKIKKYSVSLKSQVGYVPIIESILLLNSKLLREKEPYFVEINECIDIIKKYQKENQKLVRFAVDRQGKLVSVRFL